MENLDQNIYEEEEENINQEDVIRLLDLGRLLKSVLNEYELNELREILHKEELQ